MSYFLQSGDTFSPTPGREAVLDTLPVGNYTIIETPGGLMYKKVSSFEAPGRLYGDVEKRASRILTTFMDRDRSTGVLLSGEKGSGKSQLARLVSLYGYEHNMPTIVVNAPYAGDAFNTLLATVEQPAIVLMDEFEKVYDHRGAQEQVLTLLDGVASSKKLFILTVNDPYRVNEHMKNRPGRIYYSLEFSGLSQPFIAEYCRENLKDPSETENVCKVAALFGQFNFDMLKAIVEEMNRYDETAFEVVEVLNAKPIPTAPGVSFDVTVTSPDGLAGKVTDPVSELPMGTAMNQVHFYASFDTAGDETLTERLDLDHDGERSMTVSSADLKGLDPAAGRYEFVCDGYRVLFQRKERAAVSLAAY